MSSILKVDQIQLSNGNTPTVGDLGLNDTGTVLQTKSTTKTDGWTSTSSTYTDVTGMSVSITPTSTSSKILVMVNLNYGGANNLYANAKVLRNGSVISVSTAGTLSSQNNATFAVGGDNNNHQHKLNSAVYMFLDSPSSTSALTYKLQLMTHNNTTFVTVNRPYDFTNASYVSGGTSAITVMEIAG